MRFSVAGCDVIATGMCMLFNMMHVRSTLFRKNSLLAIVFLVCDMVHDSRVLRWTERQPVLATTSFVSG